MQLAPYSLGSRWIDDRAHAQNAVGGESALLLALADNFLVRRDAHTVDPVGGDGAQESLDLRPNPRSSSPGRHQADRGPDGTTSPSTRGAGARHRVGSHATICTLPPDAKRADG